MKALLNIFLFFLLIFSVNSTIYISEINFLNDEFIEIYSNKTINFSNATIIDENLGFNNLKQIKFSNSNYSLIIGTNFLNLNNISNLNCNIYSTNLISPGKFGLKNSGENITINISSNLSLNFIKNKTYSFNFNQTLNYNNENHSYFKALKSLCSKSNNQFSNIITNNTTNNSINLTTNISINQTLDININLSPKNLTNNCNNYNFKIISNKNLTKSKIKFKFKTNLKNYTINYWIEDLEKNIIKNKRNTKNINEKSFTPNDFTNIYFIKSQIISNNCNLFDSKQIIYYSKGNSYLFKKFQKIKNINSNLSSNLKISTPITLKNSYIEILNEKKILNNTALILNYEIYRGNTLKRSIYMYLNSKKIKSFQIKKNQKIEGKLKFNKTLGLNILKISGLGIEKIIKFNNFINLTNNSSNNNNSIFLKHKLKNYFNISNFQQNKTKIYFKIKTNILNLQIKCYILNKKTIVSNILNITDILNMHLINIFEKNLNSNKNTQLKFICKYKKLNLKTYNYNTIYFNYTKYNLLKNNLHNNFSIKTNISKNNLLSFYSKENLLSNQNQLKNNLNIKKTNIYSSENEKTKKDSIYLTFIGTIILLSTFIYLW